MTSYLSPPPDPKPLVSNLILNLSLSVLLMLGACSDKKIATQLAAKVNGDEISVHQINAALSRLPNVPQERVAELRKGILDKLIEQQIALQQAIELKLDRASEVAMQIEAAKKEIITQAYLNRLIYTVSKPSPEQVKQYFTEHPELFTQRKTYDLQELVVANSPSVVAQLQEWSQSHTLDEVSALLKSKGISFTPKSGVRNAEDISLDVLKNLSAVKLGKLLVLETGATVSLLKVNNVTSAPVDEATAVPRIARFLANQLVRDTIKADIDRLKNKSKIEYLNEFAKTEDNSPTAQPDNTQQTPSQTSAKSAFEKGVSDLK
jgi:EpsD family peptidyl-prolyl cis-trans isomerase